MPNLLVNQSMSGLAATFSGITLVSALAVLPGCDSGDPKQAAAQEPVEVTVIKAEARDVPVTKEFVGNSL